MTGGAVELVDMKEIRILSKAVYLAFLPHSSLKNTGALRWKLVFLTAFHRKSYIIFFPQNPTREVDFESMVTLVPIDYCNGCIFSANFLILVLHSSWLK